MDPSFLSLPPEIADPMRHLIDGAEGRLGRVGVDALLTVMRRLMLRAKARGTVEEFSNRYERLESSINALIDALERDGITSRTEIESAEPSTTDFAGAALENAISSPSEGKRAIFGRMIARRLNSATESFYELTLRDARQVVAGLNDRELVLLGALLLVQGTPLPREPFPTPDDLADYFRDVYGSTLAKFSEARWTRSDVERLLGMDTMIEISTSDVRTRGSMVKGARSRLAGMSMSSGTRSESFRNLVHEIESAFRVEMVPQQRPTTREPISDLWLLPKGAVVASFVLEANIGRRIFFPEWETLNVTELDHNALIAPFSSGDLKIQLQTQDGLRRNALLRTLKDEAAKVSDDLRRQLPRIER